MCHLIMKVFALFAFFGILNKQIIAFSQSNACRTPLNDVGQCISLRFCPEVPLFFKTLTKMQAIAYSRVLQQICGKRLTMDRYPLVCCTKPNFRPMQSNSNDYELVTLFYLEHEPELEANETLEPEPQPKPFEETTESIDFDIKKLDQNSCEGFNNERGICKPLENCTTLLNKLLKDPGDENFHTFLRSSHETCDSKTRTEICCTDLIANEPIPLSTTKAPPSRNRATKFVQPPNEQQQCGQTNVNGIDKKIVGGEDTLPGEYPWLALLGYGPKSSQVFRCGGTLITARHVLTAAHCILTELSFVRLGEWDLSAEEDINHIDIDIKMALRHEKYTRHGMLYDLAMLYLVKDVDFTAFIRPICLPMSPVLRTKSFVAYTPFAAGWGRTTETGDTAKILQKVQLRVHENEICRDAFTKVLRSKRLLAKEHFDKSILCAGELAGGKDTCKGDSGGPLMVSEFTGNKFEIHYYLIGVVSYGIGCGKVGVPAIYTSTQYFMDWILQKIQND